ncbi:hypothetical protein Clacol_003711 [Clathrus columnatus]|uniref:Uncharacterized protein n=1 Tax=Clathrus columnatus TaxID=1419009 RepID=A0AAV5A8G7_9AGAM|nr:hypothetical protein Clacol_003711 [Clathrus columnatus]
MSALHAHRCRFVDYTPTPITALAFPPLYLKNNQEFSSQNLKLECNFLALGRANGNIEIHTWLILDHDASKYAWSLYMILSGLVASKVDTLAFSLKSEIFKSVKLQNYRLFSSGGGTEVLEWDLSNGEILHSVSSQGGSIWSMAVNPASTRLALGCEDGSIRILSLENNQLAHWRRLDRVKTRLLSVAWGPPVIQQPGKPVENGNVSEISEDEGEIQDWEDSFILAGCSDSSIRKFDVPSGRSVERMTVDKIRGEKTDGTFISGDSLGNVKLWDSRTGTQLQSFTAHGADVLCLAVGSDGNTIYSSGVDQKICQFSKINIESSCTKTSINKWVNTGSRRVHSHDVRGLGVWPPYAPVPSSLLPSSPVSFLASGGLDMSLVICPCTKPNSKTLGSFAFESSQYRRLPYKTSFSNPIQLARGVGFVLCRRSNSLTLWRINNLQQADINPISSGSDWEELIEMELRLKNNLVASAISNDGSWIAASSLNELKLFRDVLKRSVGELQAETNIYSERIWLIIGGSWASSKLYVVDLDSAINAVRPLRLFEYHCMQDILIRDDDPKETHSMGAARFPTLDSQQKRVAITCLATSIDSQWFASADDLHRIHIFNLDSLQASFFTHHCALPSFPHPIIGMVFDPLNPSLLAIGLSNNTFQIFDVEARQFPCWADNLEEHVGLESLQDPLVGITFDSRANPDNQKEDRHVVLWGNSWICKVKLGGFIGNATSKKRRRESRQPSLTNEVTVPPQSEKRDEDLRVIRRYRPLLFADFIREDELLLVERPLVDLLNSLPPAYYRPKYGT